MASTSAGRRDSEFIVMVNMGPRQRANIAQTSASTSVHSGARATKVEEEPGPIKLATEEWDGIQKQLPPQITRRSVRFFLERYHVVATEYAPVSSQEYPDDICWFVMLSGKNIYHTLLIMRLIS